MVVATHEKKCLQEGMVLITECLAWHGITAKSRRLATSQRAFHWYLRNDGAFQNDVAMHILWENAWVSSQNQENEGYGFMISKFVLKLKCLLSYWKSFLNMGSQHTHTRHNLKCVFYCLYWVGEKAAELQRKLPVNNPKPANGVLSSLWRFSQGVRTGESLHQGLSR